MRWQAKRRMVAIWRSRLLTLPSRLVVMKVSRKARRRKKKVRTRMLMVRKM